MSGRIRTDVDLDRPGRQVGRLRVPWPRNSSAWGALLVPIAVIRNGEGPTVLLCAGAHGDEYEGPVALAELIRELTPDEVRGTVIVLPAMNPEGLARGERLSPPDGRDLNRAYPGRADGSPSEALAHWIGSELVRRADAVLDLHSGGRSLRFAPCVLTHHLSDPAFAARARAALEATGAPIGVILEELDDTGMLDGFVESRGKLFLTTELGGGGGVSPDALEVGRRCVWRLLAHLGVIDADHPRARAGGETPQRLVDVPGDDAYVVAPRAGLYAPLKEVGAQVEAEEPVCELLDLQEPERPPTVLQARRSGLLLACRAPAVTAPGDCLAVIASPHEG